MKLLVTGARSITNFDLDEYIPKETVLIISGGATGVDALAEKYADEHGISKLILRPNHNEYGKIAEPMLTIEMVNISNHVLIIENEESEETKKVKEIAKKGFKPVTVVTVK